VGGCAAPALLVPAGRLAPFLVSCCPDQADALPAPADADDAVASALGSRRCAAGRLGAGVASPPRPLAGSSARSRRRRTRAVAARPSRGDCARQRRRRRARSARGQSSALSSNFPLRPARRPSPPRRARLEGEPIGIDYRCEVGTWDRPDIDKARQVGERSRPTRLSPRLSRDRQSGCPTGSTAFVRARRLAADPDVTGRARARRTAACEPRLGEVSATSRARDPARLRRPHPGWANHAAEIAAAAPPWAQLRKRRRPATRARRARRGRDARVIPGARRDGTLRPARRRPSPHRTGTVGRGLRRFWGSEGRGSDVAVAGDRVRGSHLRDAGSDVAARVRFVPRTDGCSCWSRSGSGWEPFGSAAALDWIMASFDPSRVSRAGCRSPRPLPPSPSRRPVRIAGPESRSP